MQPRGSGPSPPLLWWCALFAVSLLLAISVQVAHAFYIPAMWIGGTQSKNPGGSWATLGARVSPATYYPNNRNYACVASARATAGRPGAGTVWFGFGQNQAGNWWNDLWTYDIADNTYVVCYVLSRAIVSTAAVV